MRNLIILGENFVNDQNTYTVSSGDGQKGYIYDQKRITQWESTASAEGNSETIQIDFKDRVGDVATRTIDRLIFLNCNLAKFKVEYWTGAAWALISESNFTVIPNTTTEVYIEMAASVSTQKLLITMTNTIGAVADKAIGEFKACLHIVELTNKVNFQRSDWDNGGAFRLHGGSLVSFKDVSKVEASVTLNQVPLATFNLLEPLVKDRSWMTWVLFEDFRRADIYEFKAVTPLKVTFDFTISRYTMSFGVAER